MDGIIFRLENFEGPLDLLLHLIEKHKIDINNIPIAQLTDSYLEYLSILERMNMDNLSEFIVMAATLIELKSRLLLPPADDEDEEEGDPREELMRRLIEYKQYKEAAEDFSKRWSEGGAPIFKDCDAALKKEILGRNDDKSIDDILNGADTEMLYRAFLEVMKRKELRVDKVRSDFSHVVKDPFTVEDKMAHIKNALSIKSRIEFTELFGKRSSKSEKITTFLALLELMKAKIIEVMQDNTFGRILISKKEGGKDEAQ